jgi:hypothetical protein
MKYIFALLISLSPTPAYLGICYLYEKNLIILALLQLLSGVFVGMMINKFNMAVIMISVFITSILMAGMSDNKDALWTIPPYIATMMTMIQLVTVDIGISMKKKYTRKMEPANPLLKG